MMKISSSRVAGMFLALGLLSCGRPSVESKGAGEGAPPSPPPLAQLMIVPPELKTPPTVTVNQAAIGIVNEIGPDKSPSEWIFHAKTDAPLWVRGWAYDESHKTTPGTVWIELTNKRSGQRFFLPTSRADGSDVADGFKLPWARNSRFGTPVITGHNIPRGAYDMKVYQVQDGVAELTKYYPAPVMTLEVE